MDFKGMMLSKISQTDKDKYYMISLIHGIKRKKKKGKKKILQTEKTYGWLPEAEGVRRWGKWVRGWSKAQKLKRQGYNIQHGNYN